ncbi:hypothetical protein LCGC14_1399470 [marine sediment metagenome]|uniref:Uncharacterized protein n=1 Tax=marine sediment metagenome TaxID=412755 RepID=A0A0F9MZ43_9ZZZZ
MKTIICPKCNGKGYVETKGEDTFCHIECMGKSWMLMESEGGIKKRTPSVMQFSCLAEARKAMITYQKNPDFQNIEFSLEQLAQSKQKQKEE